MLAKESAVSQFDLPEEVLDVLPSDPFEQLDVARKITSLALSARVSALESEASALHGRLAEKDRVIDDLQSQLESLDASLSDTTDKLAQAEHQRETLLKENASLYSTVRKLNRDVSKLEAFRKTLMQSLHEDEESSAGSVQLVTEQIPAQPSLSSAFPIREDDAPLQPSRSSSIQSQFTEMGSSSADDRDIDVPRPTISQSLLLASQTSTPRFTPPGSPPSLSAAVSPTRSKPVPPRRHSMPVSPKRHSISFSTSRGTLDDKYSVYSSMPSSLYSSVSSSDSGSQTG
ncbi:uncharacterized protein At4g15545 isoform X2 [Malania oleifera]|nr:uncharacterized protein At4g15545 isoform X2 [Malania oleifera]